MWSRFWQDFNSENDWRLPDVAPSQLPELLAYPIVDHSERVRAEWMWRPTAEIAFGIRIFRLLPVNHGRRDTTACS